ncbi:MAG: hypothetical protein K0B09_02110 [Bacteroidales bacterium]|nr:hypothetical protein [Bacteroidales bacterium]
MKTVFSFLIFSLIISLGIKAQSLEEKLSGHIHLIVSQDGRGDVITLQEAIDRVPENNRERFVIFIRNGVYKEKIKIPANKPHITLIGEDAENVILTWDDFSGKVVGNDTITTSTSFSFAVEADDFTAMNLTFENSAGPVGQAVALRTNGDRQFFYRVRLIGNQDTFYTWGNIRNYLLDCYIEGTTDYIFGRSTVVFQNCHLHSKKTGSYITAASTEEYAKFGYVFFNSRFTADTDTRNVALGRPWRPFAKTVIINSFLDDFIRPEGWSIWQGRETNHLNSYYAEYGNFGPGADTSNRIEWSHQLSDSDLESYTLQNIFAKNTNPDFFENDWLPDPDADPVFQIVKASLTEDQSDFPDFLKGTWKMENKDVFERWDMLNENSLKGVSYVMENGQMTVIEYLDISRDGNDVIYSANVLGQNDGKRIEFRQTNSGNAFVFENPNHDFPKKIVYHRLSDNELFVQVSDGKENGFSYKTSRLPEIIKEKDTTVSNPDFDPQLALKLGADDYGMKSYILVMLKTGTNQTTDTDFINACFRGHMENIGRLAAEGKLIVAGPLGRNEKTYRGIFILDDATLEEAEALLQTDPAISEKLLDAELYSWYGSAALPMYLDFSEKIWKLKF